MMITPEIEAALHAQERNRTNIPAAREALETAILHQFRWLARRMIAWEAVAGHLDDTNVWRQSYLAETGDDEWTGDTGDPEYLLFREEFAEQMANGTLVPLRRESLGEVKIRAYGGRYNLWQEGRVNRQLAALGSDLRVCLVGAERLRARSLVGLLVKTGAEPLAVDGRFLVGYLNALTAHPLAPMFDFARECAVSPLVPPEASGFCDEGRIIVRDLPFRLLRHRGGEYSRVSVLLHEMGHVIWGDMVEGSRSTHMLRASWPMRVREDICRFTREPRSRTELESMSADFTRMKSVTPAVADDPDFEAILDALLREEALVKLPDGRLHCELYMEGRPWTY